MGLLESLSSNTMNFITTSFLGVHVADIEISRANPYSKEETITRLQDMTQKMEDRLKLKVAWSGDQGQFSGPAKGAIRVSESSIDIEVKLGLAVKLIKGKIAEGIEKGLDKALA